MELSHSDERRDLYSFPEAKLIIANKDTVIGQHFHKIKEEIFILTSGVCNMYLTPQKDLRGRIPMSMIIGAHYRIPPGQYHEFHLAKDSTLIGLNSRPYDPSDDYKV